MVTEGQPHTRCDDCLFAAVDIGTVSTRLILAHHDAAGPLEILERITRITDLGEGVDATGMLSTQALQRTIDVVSDYVALIRTYQANMSLPVRAVCTATSAARDAGNAAELLDPVRSLGLAPQIIDGTCEAHLALLGVTADFPDEELLVADIGGGSTELARGRRRPDGTLDAGRSISYNVGARRVTERFFPDGGPVPAEVRMQARDWIAEQWADYFSTALDGQSGLPHRLVSVGGTATSLVAIKLQLIPYDSTVVHLSSMSYPDVHALTEHLLDLSTEQRKALPGIQAQRAGVIAGGALIVDVLMQDGGWDALCISESDSQIGLLMCLEAQETGAPSPLEHAPESKLFT